MVYDDDITGSLACGDELEDFFGLTDRTAGRHAMAAAQQVLDHALIARAPEMRWIALPANRGVAWLAERLAHPEDDNVAGDTADPRLNILVVEPDDARRAAMMARIAGRGDRVTACRRVGDAMTVLSGLASAAQAPHAIVSDVHLGDGDGLSFYLAASRRFPDIRWIVTAPPQRMPAVA